MAGFSSYGIALNVNGYREFNIHFVNKDERYAMLDGYACQYLISSEGENMMGIDFVKMPWSYSLGGYNSSNYIKTIQFDETAYKCKLTYKNTFFEQNYHSGVVRAQLPMYESTVNHTLVDYYPEVRLYNTETQQYVPEDTYDIEYVSQTQIKIRFFHIAEFRKLKAILIGRKDEPATTYYYIESTTDIIGSDMAIQFNWNDENTAQADSDINGIFSVNDNIYIGYSGVDPNSTIESTVVSFDDNKTINVSGDLYSSYQRIAKRTAFTVATYGTEYDIASTVPNIRYQINGDHSAEFTIGTKVRITDSNGDYWFDIVKNIAYKGTTNIDVYVGLVENATTICTMSNVS